MQEIQYNKYSEYKAKNLVGNPQDLQDSSGVVVGKCLTKKAFDPDTGEEIDGVECSVIKNSALNYKKQQEASLASVNELIKDMGWSA